MKNHIELSYKDFINETIKNGWNRNVLLHHIKTELYKRDKNNKLTNFSQTLSNELSELATDMIKSEYNLEFSNLDKKAKEIEVEYSLNNTNQPMGVSTYILQKTLPKELSKILDLQ